MCEKKLATGSETPAKKVYVKWRESGRLEQTQKDTRIGDEKSDGR